jgi:hypothetical protein
LKQSKYCVFTFIYFQNPFRCYFVFASQQVVLRIWMFFLFSHFLQLNTQSKFSTKITSTLTDFINSSIEKVHLRREDI